MFKLTNDGSFADAGLTPPHIADLSKLGLLLENAQNVRKLNKFVAGSGIAAFGLAAHPVAAVTAAATTAAAAVPGYAMSRVLGKVLTDPQFAANVVKLLQAGRAVGSGAAAQGARAIYGGATSLQ